MDISTLAISELKSLLEKIPAEIKRREKSEKARLRKELEEFALKNGYSLDELLGEAAEKANKLKKPVAVKFRHPQEGDLTWTGRGRQPKWVEAFLSAGGTLEQLTV